MVSTIPVQALGKRRRISPRYWSPINTCPQCGTPTSGVLCTPCTTK